MSDEELDEIMDELEYIEIGLLGMLILQGLMLYLLVYLLVGWK